jgi:hypothetical protein
MIINTKFFSIVYYKTMPKSVDVTSKLFHERSFQIALVGSILFLLLAHPILYNLVDRLFSFVGIQLSDTLLVVVHSVVYAVALYFSIILMLKVEVGFN